MSDPLYESTNGFMTSVWGPMLWHVLHMISMNYPIDPSKAERAYYYNFIHSLKHVLPCGTCRNNMFNNLDLNKKTHLKNRKSFSLWVYNFHNEINSLLQKGEYKSFEEAREFYETFRAKCNKNNVDTLGCVSPANGLRKKCLLTIVPYTKDIQIKSDNVYDSSKMVSKTKIV